MGFTFTSQEPHIVTPLKVPQINLDLDFYDTIEGHNFVFKLPPDPNKIQKLSSLKQPQNNILDNEPSPTLAAFLI
jgi:hypothetical protein